MQDVADQEIRDSYRLPFNNSTDNTNGRTTNSNGFVVQGGPWEQRAPNMQSVIDFPSFGGRHAVEEPKTLSPTGVWGARR